MPTALSGNSRTLLRRFATAVGALVFLTPTSAFGASTSQVHVTIATDGPSPTQTYVAAVPYERPLGAPLQEQVIAGHTITFTLPEGRYRFVAGAPDYGVEQSDFIYLAPSSAESVTLSLKYLSSISGRVTDTAGRPIAAAKVGLPGAFRVDYADKLSATAEALLRPSAVVETDSTGVFVLPVHSLGTSFLFVEAVGYAPAMLAQVRAANSTVGDIRLQPGARLEARVAPSHYDRIQLLPRSAMLPDALSLSGAVALWSRAVGSRVRWDSLPPGKYDVCFTISPAQPQQAPPRCVSTVDLTAGTKQTVVLVPPRLAVAAHQKTLRLQFPQTAAAQLRQLAVQRWVGATYETLPQKNVHIQGASMQLERCVPGAAYVLSSSTLIAATGTVTTCSARDLAILPRSTFLVRLRGPAGARLPRQAVLDARSCKGTPVFSFSIQFAVDEHGFAAVPVPMGCSDLRVSAGLLFSDRLPNRNTIANGIPQPTNATLRIGSSIATRVRDAQGHFVPAHADLLSASGSAESTAMTVVSSANTDEWGQIWIPAVPDGQYVLRVTAPDAGELYRSEAFNVRPQEQFYLPDIVLPKRGVKSRSEGKQHQSNSVQHGAQE